MSRDTRLLEFMRKNDTSRRHKNNGSRHDGVERTLLTLWQDVEWECAREEYGALSFFYYLRVLIENA